MTLAAARVAAWIGMSVLHAKPSGPAALSAFRATITVFGKMELIWKVIYREKI